MRYNMFNQIHKALRVLLYDTGVLISQTDFDILFSRHGGRTTEPAIGFVY
jgi:hypothetical protein